MDLEAEIEAQLEALSDCSSEELYGSDADISMEEALSSPRPTETVNESEKKDWLQLFLERTSEQTKKTENTLHDAEDVLKEVEENVIRCQSRFSTVEDEIDSTVNSESKTVITEEEILDDVKEQQIYESPPANTVSDLVNESLSTGTSELDDSIDMEVSHLSANIVEEVDKEDDRFKEFNKHRIETQKKIKDFNTLCDQEIALRIDDIESERAAKQKHLNEIQEEEMKILSELQRQKLFYEEERNNRAVLLIQCCYRGYIARKRYGPILVEKLKALKVRRTEERIRVIEEGRKAQAAAAQQKINDLNKNKNIELENEVGVEQVTSTDGDPVTNHLNVIDDSLQQPDADHETTTSRFESRSGFTLHDNEVTALSILTETVTSAPQQNDVVDEEAIHEEKELNKSALEEDSKIVALSSDKLLITPEVTSSDVTPAQSEKSVLQRIHHDLAFLEESVNFSSGADVIDDYVQNELTSSDDDRLPCPSLGSSDVIHDIINDDDLHSKGDLRDDAKASGGMLNVIDQGLKLLQSSVHLKKKSEMTADSLPVNLEKIECQTLAEDCNDLVVKKVADESVVALKLEAKVTQIDVEHAATSSADNDTAPLCENKAVIIACDDKILDDPQLRSTLAPVVKVAEEQLTHVLQHSIEAEKDCYDKPAIQGYLGNDQVAQEDILEYHQTLLDSNHVIKNTSANTGTECGDLKSIQKYDAATSSQERLSSSSLTGENIKTTSKKSNEGTTSDLTTQEELCTNDSHTEEIFENMATSFGSPRNVSIKDEEDANDHTLDTESQNTSVKSPQHYLDISTSDVVVASVTGISGFKEKETKTELSADENEEASGEPDINLAPIHHSSPQIVDNSLSNSNNNNNEERDLQLETLDSNCQKVAKSDNITLWQSWKSGNIKWQDKKLEAAMKPHLRRGVRRSSAAKRLPPLSEEEMMNGKWPHFKDLSDCQSIDTMSRIYLINLAGNGKNLSQVQRCVNLTHLTLINCGLVSLEGLQSCPSIRHVNVSNNQISVLSCDGMKRLESLVVIGNSLTSIHGLDGCSELVFLDFSHNNITRINGLDSLRSLFHLRLSHNHLMNMKMLCVVNTLVTLDISNNNLSTLEGIENCGLLRCINASNNCFVDFPTSSLTNAVSLVHLDLSENSISNFSFVTDPSIVWLPSLMSLNLRQNQITFENKEYDASTTPLLRKLNLRQNIISDGDDLIEKLGTLSCFSEVVLSENAFSKGQEINVFETAKQSGFDALFLGLNDSEVPLKSTKLQVDVLKRHFVFDFLSCEAIHSLTSDPFLTKLIEQANGYLDIILCEKDYFRDIRGWRLVTNQEEEDAEKELLQMPADAVACHCDYLRKHFELAVKHRSFHESSFTFSSPNHVTSSGHAFRPEYTAENRSPAFMATCDKQTRQNSKATNGGRPNQKVQPISLKSLPKDSSDKHPIAISQSSTKHSKSSESNLADRRSISFPNATSKGNFNRDYSKEEVYNNKLIQPKIAITAKNLAALKIQTCWRRYAIQRNYRNLLEKRCNSAVIIQSVWRGYIVRRDIRKAYTSIDESFEFNEEDYGEVDLSALDFDEEKFEKQWAFKTDFARQVTPQVREKNVSSPSLSRTDITRDFPSQASTTRQDSTNTFGLLSSQEIRSNIASLSKPPLPPITPTSSRNRFHDGRFSSTLEHESNTSTTDTYRSSRNQKEEELSNEWGLHSKEAIEMMLKRAKRMKGRRKKEINAEEKLKRFQDMSQRSPQQPLTTRRKPVQSPTRMAYFKAREMQFEEREKIPSEEDERRMQYTYEWLHTKVNNSEQNLEARNVPNRARITTSEGSSIKSGFLPVIPQRNTPVSPQAGNIEVMSVSSYNSNRSRSKELLRSIARRHGEYDKVGMRR